MKRLTIVLIAVLLSVSLLAACTPGVLMDWIASIGNGSVTPGNAVSYGNSLPFVSFGGVEYATAGNIVTAGGVVSAGSAPVATMGNATAGNAATPGSASANSPASVQPLLPTPTPMP